MDPNDAMVAPAASEMVGGELDQGHELCLWADELDDLVLPMDPNGAMVAPTASELVGGELDQGHELCFWGDELDEASRMAMLDPSNDAAGHASSWPMATMHNALGLSIPLTSNTTLAAAQPAVGYVAKYLAKPALQLDFDFGDMPELESASSSDFDPDDILEHVGDSSSDFDFDDMPELGGSNSSDIDDMPNLGALALNALGGTARKTLG